MDSGTVSHKRQRERTLSNDADADGAEHGEEQEKQRKRARLSCNTCKARKTKAKTGACQYCRTLGIPCEADPKSRKRPFYRVSGEVYEYSIKLLRRFVSEDELPELTVENIEALLQKLDNGGSTLPNSLPPAPPLPARPTDVGLVRAEQTASNDVMELDEHPLLQEELGCMLLDSKGKYRYVGADSNIRWNHAARMARVRDPLSNIDPKIIPPLQTGLLPPTSPEDTINRRPEDTYLPPRQMCMAYVARFFDQIHCIYWLYSTEQFYTRLDETYGNSGTTASSSWLCALYSIFAMGSMHPAGVNDGPHDSKTSLDYLTMARELLPTVANEAGVDSIKAYALLSLATHATCFSVAAYLHLGTAMRIAFSLGLHRDVSLRNKDSLERERSRRLWWTIYVLDYEMASRFDYPCSVMANPVYMRVPPATEQILDPGPNTPLGYQALLVSLVQLRKRISHECFLEPAQLGGRLPISRVTNCLAALREWQAGVPTHLRADSSVHPQHRRAVSLLHMRYWIATIALTRPFLLFTVTKLGTTQTIIPVKRKIYEQMSNNCIEAAESAVQILRRMREDNTLSSLMLLDCHYIGEVIWILILALQRHGGPERQEMLRFCLETVKGMEKVGWAEKVGPELETRVHESGVLEQAANNEPQMQQQYPYWSAGMVPPNGGGDNDMNLDVFETLDLDHRPGMLDMFMDASFSGSQFLFDDLDGSYHG
ncbi:fungal-specific transcription factor domain-containing protein [Coniochaeta sp. 2T2.1]|nr:fungal-specific transcription factor domain-containing protein [Coniochaeta sp. 2T2.1]